MSALSKIFGEMVRLPSAIAFAARRVEHDPALKTFRKHMRKMHVPAGTELSRKGETAAMLYLVVAGTARRIEEDVEIGAGAFFGGQAILSGNPIAAATVRAESDLTLLALPIEAARALCVAEPDIGYLVAQRLFQSRPAAPRTAPVPAEIPQAIAA